MPSGRPVQWMTTLFLVFLAGVGTALAPRLLPAPVPEAEPEALYADAMDVCVSLGRFECCVKDEKSPEK